jgi:hypothetical protein
MAHWKDNIVYVVTILFSIRPNLNRHCHVRIFLICVLPFRAGTCNRHRGSVPAYVIYA